MDSRLVTIVNVYGVKKKGKFQNPKVLDKHPNMGENGRDQVVLPCIYKRISGKLPKDLTSE